MSLNSVSSNLYFCVYSTQKISEETRKKLIALGINPNTVTSEAQAQALIAKIEKTQSVKEPTNESSSKNTISSEQDYETQKNNENAIFSMFEMDANLNKLLFKL